jgi:hypothetical protein
VERAREGRFRLFDAIFEHTTTHRTAQYAEHTYYSWSTYTTPTVDREMTRK